MDYVAQFEYALFMMDTINEQEKMDRYIQECLILTEGVDVVEKLTVLNEGKLQNAWQKFKNFIKKIIEKFKHSMSELFSSDKGYLEKYKKIILNKQFDPNDTFTMPDYFKGLERLSKHGIDSLVNYQSLAPTLEKGEEEFQKKVLSEYDNKDEWADFCKFYFLGSDSKDEKKEFKGDFFDGTKVKDMYNFCYDFKVSEEKISKDQAALDKLSREVEKILKELASKNLVQNNTTNTKVDNTGGEEPETTTEMESMLFITPYVYSSVLESYITEVEIKGGEKSDNNTSVNKGSNNTSFSKNITNVNDTETIEKINKKEKIEIPEATININGKPKTEEEITKDVEVYNKVCGTFIAAKLTALQKIYKEFMSIIRYHVKKNLGTSAANNRVGDSEGTDYSKGTEKLKEKYKKETGIELSDNDCKTILDNLSTINKLNKEGKLDSKDGSAAINNLQKFVKNGTPEQFINNYINFAN